MYLQYMDESGVTDRHPSQTTHYVMMGMAVHEGTWFALSKLVRDLKQRYALEGNVSGLELHAAWMLHAIHEQSLMPSFDQLSRRARYDAVQSWRDARRKNDWPSMEKRSVDREKKAFRRTEPYIHLTRAERDQLYQRALGLVGGYRRGVVLFGEAIDKRHLAPGVDPAEEAFSRLINRFEDFLQEHDENVWGALVVDYNQTQNSRYTEMVARFQQQDGFRGGIDRIIESPFFLDSRSNSGVQVADLCAYALRRYVENREVDPFSVIFPKFHRVDGKLSGLRHFTQPGCDCMICAAPRSQPTQSRPRRKRRRKQGSSNTPRPTPANGP